MLSYLSSYRRARLCTPTVRRHSYVSRYATTTTTAKPPRPSKLRNIGIIAHVDAGKTTTCERMLYYSGKTAYVGDVDKGDTVMDYLKMERERGITINAAAITFNWQGYTINLIDTPGHVDFTMEVERSVRVLDGAVTILDAVAGVQAQTETVWNQADRYKVPRIIYLNKMDREGASVTDAIESLKSRLGANPLLVQLPIGVAKRFKGAVDLITMELLTWSEDNYGAVMDRLPLTPEDERLWTDARAARTRLVEQLAEVDEPMMEFFLNDNDPGANAAPDAIRAALRRATLGMKGYPTFVGSSLRNKGVQPIMDAILDYLPAPEERPPIEATDEEGNTVDIVCNPNGPLAAQAFKVVYEPGKGPIVYFRVYSGTLVSGQKLYNTISKQSERSMRILRVTADHYLDQREVKAGDIGAAIGLKHTKTGDTLVGDKDAKIKLAGIQIPEPVFYCSITPVSQSTEDALKEALNNLQLEDPSFKWMVNKDNGQWMMCGMGELHLEILIDRLKNHYKVPFYTGAITIAYRTTIQDSIEEEYTRTYETSPGKLETATIHLKLEPLPRGSGIQLLMNGDYSDFLPNNKRMRTEILEVVKQALSDAARNGVPSGFPLHDISISVERLEYIAPASPNTFRLVTLQAVWDLVKKAGIQLMEPLMRVELTVDEKYYGNAISDITSRRRGSIETIKETVGNKRQFIALVPLKELMGFSTELRSQTKGTGFFSMDFEKYEVLGQHEQKQVLSSLGYTGFV